MLDVAPKKDASHEPHSAYSGGSEEHLVVQRVSAQRATPVFLRLKINLHPANVIPTKPARKMLKYFATVLQFRTAVDGRERQGTATDGSAKGLKNVDFPRVS